MTEARKPVILDVDTGVDDALALLLAVQHPALEVAAVTCVGGNVSLNQVVANTLAVLALAGARDIPVAAGMAAPLVEPARSASYVHGTNGLADLELPAHGLRAEAVHAVELQRVLLEEAPEPVTIIALAPLTNVAILLRMYPHVAEKLAGITFMGGAIGVGNATATAEFNVWHDPEATEMVLRSGVPITMYGLEPFRRVTVTAADVVGLRSSGSPVRRTAGALLAQRDGIVGELTADGTRVVSVGDAGAVCAVIEPDGVTSRRAHTTVALAPGLTRGQTVVDLRTAAEAARDLDRDGQDTVEVITGVDGERYRRIFLDTLR